MKRYFITGTDTDCGKTYVTCRLLDYFKEQTKSVIGLKPVASGCNDEGGIIRSDDEEQIRKHNDILIQRTSPWRFKAAISPNIAAAFEGKDINVNEVIDYCNDAEFSKFDYQLIEGAGGLMVPLSDSLTWIDFLKLSKIPVILVVGMRLGCINHALLTELALKTHNLICVGWIANCLDKEMQALDENIAILSQKISAPLLAKIKFGTGSFDDEFNKLNQLF